MRCLCYCVAERFNLAQIERFANSSSSFKVTKFWRCLMLETEESIVFVFTNGTWVSWGLKAHEARAHLQKLQPFQSKTLSSQLSEGFSYQYGTKTSIHPHRYFNVECITLENNEHDVKLALSYGLSQSIKLKLHEEQIELLFNNYAPLAKTMAEHGTLRLSRKKTRCIIGEILSAKVTLNLSGGFLFQPEFFWEHASLAEYYQLIESYMDIPFRSKILTERLNTLNEIFLMLNETLESHHSHRLEMIIIVLIAAEIIIALLHKI